MRTLIAFIRIIRGYVMRSVRTKSSYLSKKDIKPISVKYGYDRGKPIDRYCIEKFLEEYKDCVKGRCLEIVDNNYTRKYGQKKVIQGDVLDIFVTKQANIHGDLRDLRSIIPSETYDCLVITQTLNVIDDYEAAIKECYRILKPGGTLLATLPTISPTWNLKINMWRFSVKSAQYVFGKYFKSKDLVVKPYGNSSTVRFFWSGFAIEDMTRDELEKNDPKSPLIIGVKATK